eukprot:m.91528 g.91528  ORF g.91528 m.91528 type:complete len:119 (-) comp8873_c7_seq2:1745-2101(-)
MEASVHNDDMNVSFSSNSVLPGDVGTPDYLNHVDLGEVESMSQVLNAVMTHLSQSNVEITSSHPTSPSSTPSTLTSSMRNGQNVTAREAGDTEHAILLSILNSIKNFETYTQDKKPSK